MSIFSKQIKLCELKPSGVALKFIFWASVSIIICMVILAVSFTRGEKAKSVEGIKNEARILTRAFAAGSSGEFSKVEPTVLHKHIREMRKITSVAFVRIYDQKGRCIASTDREFEDQELQREILLALNKNELVIDESRYAGNKIFDVVVSWGKPFQKTGFIRLGYSTELLELRLRETYRHLILSTLTAIFGSILASCLVSRLVSKPVSELMAATARVKSGNLDSMVRVQTRDEFRALADSFNHMVASLKSSRQELKEYQQLLEKRVEERTSELAEANSRLEKLYRLKSQLVAYITHELGTPLTVMKESISMITDGVAGKVDPSQEDLLRMSQRNVGRLINLLGNVLDFTRFESGKFQLNLTDCDPKRIVDQSVQMLSGQAEKKKISIECRQPDALPHCRMDKTKTTQVMTNLLSNAIKFTPTGGRIRVETDVCDGTGDGSRSLRIRVSDTGPGIKLEEMDRLFREFEQLDSGRTSGTPGTGLGLAISKRIVEAHGGRIWAESPAEWEDTRPEGRHGTKFTFILPLAL